MYPAFGTCRRQALRSIGSARVARSPASSLLSSSRKVICLRFNCKPLICIADAVIHLERTSWHEITACSDSRHPVLIDFFLVADPYHQRARTFAPSGHRNTAPVSLENFGYGFSECRSLCWRAPGLPGFWRTPMSACPALRPR